MMATHWRSGTYHLDPGPLPDGSMPKPTMCSNETNDEALFGTPSITDYPKDGIDRHVRLGEPSINPENRGTKGAWWYRLTVAPGESQEIRTAAVEVTGEPSQPRRAGRRFRRTVRHPAGRGRRVLRRLGTGELPRRRAGRHADGVCRDDLEQAVLPVRRSALGGRRPGQPAPPRHRPGAITTGATSTATTSFPCRMPGVSVVRRLGPGLPHRRVHSHRPCLREVPTVADVPRVVHASQRRATGHEWNFGDTNPPVHAWRRCVSLEIDGTNDYAFLAEVFQKLLMNFTWWVNRVDPRATTCSRGLPRPGQRRADQPLTTAEGLWTRAGGRHRLDGLLPPFHAADRAAVGRARRGLRRDGAEVRRALRGHHRRDGCQRDVGLAGRFFTTNSCAPMGRRSR